MRLLTLLFALSACGVRHIARPATPDGYKSIALQDIPAVGMKDVNVELVGMLGPMVPQEICHGLVTFPLMEVTRNTAGGITFRTGGVTLSFPRVRYNELRDLQPNDQVRVRGYVSKYLAEGCDYYMLTADRYVWVDTIEKVAIP